jgi:hypothetical protein
VVLSLIISRILSLSFRVRSIDLLNRCEVVSSNEPLAIISTTGDIMADSMAMV